MENKYSSEVENLSTCISNSSRIRTEKLLQGKDVVSETSSIISACRELEALLTSPEDWIGKFAGSYNNSVALCLVLDLKIPTYLSERETTSIDTLIGRTGASKSIISNEILQMMTTQFWLWLGSIMTQCAQSQIFDEPSPEEYKLNSYSVCLLEANFASWVHYL